MTTTVRALNVPQLDTKAALHLAAEEAARITGADGAAIAIGNASAMCCCACAGVAPDVGVMVGPDSGLSGVCLRTSEWVQCDDTANDPRIDPQAGMSLGSVLIVPVIVDGRLQAILEVVSSKSHAFTAEHRHELTRMAQGIATLLADVPGKRPPRSETREYRPSSTVDTAIQQVETAGSNLADDAIVELSPAWQEESTAFETGPDEEAESEGSAFTALLDSLSTAQKAGIVVALIAVIALGWYLVGGTRTSVGGAKPNTASANSAAPDAGAPEITIEQNSLSVGGLEGATKVTGSALQLTPGQLLRKVQPIYPETARAQGIGGTVVLTALVTKQGSVANVKFVRGPEALASAAIDAVRQWVYEPYRLGSEPVAVQTMIVLRFTPRKQP
jgi:TonB family protein